MKNAGITIAILTSLSIVGVVNSINNHETIKELREFQRYSLEMDSVQCESIINLYKLANDE